VTTINGKNVLAAGTILFNTGDVVRVASNPSIIFQANEAAPYGLVGSVDSAGNFVLSINGMATNSDVATHGTGLMNGAPMRFSAYAFRAASASPTNHLYKVDYSFVAA